MHGVRFGVCFQLSQQDLMFNLYLKHEHNKPSLTEKKDEPASLHTKYFFNLRASTSTCLSENLSHCSHVFTDCTSAPAIAFLTTFHTLLLDSLRPPQMQKDHILGFVVRSPWLLTYCLVRQAEKHDNAQSSRKKENMYFASMPLCSPLGLFDRFWVWDMFVRQAFSHSKHKLVRPVCKCCTCIFTLKLYSIQNYLNWDFTSDGVCWSDLSPPISRSAMHSYFSFNIQIDSLPFKNPLWNIFFTYVYIILLL